MLRIGLTGGIGSGKSAAAKLFAAHGAPIIDADDIVRALSAAGGEAYTEILAQFGKGFLRPDKEIDRSRLRCHVFAAPEERRRLEAILHPKVRKEMQAQLTPLNAPYVILVIPLLVETGPWDIVDRILVIDVGKDTQINRVKGRGLDESEIRTVIASQASREERLQRADDVICNEGSLEDLARDVEQLHRHYLALASDATSDTRR